MGFRQKIKEAMESVKNAGVTGQSAGVDARQGIAEARAVVDVLAGLADDLQERGLHVELDVAGFKIPIGLTFSIPDKEVTDGQTE